MMFRDSESRLLELAAMAKIADIMDTLPNSAARARVMQWAADTFGLQCDADGKTATDLRLAARSSARPIQ